MAWTNVDGHKQHSEMSENIRGCRNSGEISVLSLYMKTGNDQAATSLPPTATNHAANHAQHYSTLQIFVVNKALTSKQPVLNRLQ